MLRDVFGFSHAEIAAALSRSEPSARQLAHRAREHVQAGRGTTWTPASSGR